MMTDQQDFANARADATALQFIKEACSITGAIKETTFDEVLDVSIESMKANVDASNLSEEKKAQIKADRELLMRMGAERFKEELRKQIK